MTTVTWTPDDSYRIKSSAGFEMSGTRSSEDSGLTPIELISSSLGLCVSISLVKLFERDGLDPAPISVHVEAAKAADAPSRIERFDVSVVLPEHIDNDIKEKYILMAERACTIGNTLKHGAKIDVTLS